MIFVTSRHKRAIEDHFDRTFELEDALEKSNKAELLAAVRAVKPDDMECVFVRQAQALGLGHAVLCGRHLVGDHPFAVLLPDDLMIGTPPILAQMVDAVRGAQGVDHRGAGSAGRAHPALRHRRRATPSASGWSTSTGSSRSPRPRSRRRASASPAATC